MSRTYRPTTVLDLDLFALLLELEPGRLDSVVTTDDLEDICLRSAMAHVETLELMA